MTSDRAGSRPAGLWIRSHEDAAGLTTLRASAVSDGVTGDGRGGRDVEALNRPVERDPCHHVAAGVRELRKPSALGTEDEHERRVGNLEREHVGGAVGVEADAPELRPPRALEE